MEAKWIYLIFGIVWLVICLYFVIMGGKHLNKPHAKFEKVPIIVGLAVAGLLGLLAIIGVVFFS